MSYCWLVPNDEVSFGRHKRSAWLHGVPFKIVDAHCMFGIPPRCCVFKNFTDAASDIDVNWDMDDLRPYAEYIGIAYVVSDTSSDANLIISCVRHWLWRRSVARRLALAMSLRSPCALGGLGSDLLQAICAHL